MTIDWQFDQIQDLREDYDIEAKAAQGADGQGAFPNAVWESYSAMANTQGGIILLGIKEKSDHKFEIVGLAKPDPVLKALWDGVNNPKQVSVNLLSNEDVQVIDIEGKRIIRVQVPAASRSQRPVFIKGNPVTGTYRRNYEGDYRCPQETVNRMLAEQIEDARDARVLDGYDFSDLDLDSVKSYRVQFKSRQPDHPWNECEMRDFLWNIGAWGRDRSKKVEGPTVGGILMFGTLRAILDAIPNYIVDYQERPQAKTEKRWVDRLTTDGTWSGNLYDFYRQVIRKLHADLKVPFQLKGAERIEDTPVHIALREAFVNTLIHADYSGRVSVMVVKRPDMFGFRNPGGLRIPLVDAKRGGDSDCRNRNLQKMFQLLGAGEQAGSGITKIYTGWSSQHWRQPEFMEKITADREEILLQLRMVSLLPDDAVEELGERFGAQYYELPESHRIALAAALIEGSLTHSRMVEMTNDHPHDLSKTLHELVENKFLDSDGTGRGTYYFLPGCHPVSDDSLSEVEKLSHKDEELSHKDEELSHKDAELSHKLSGSEELRQVSEVVASSERSSREEVEKVIVTLCGKAELSVQEMAELLNRQEQTVRKYIDDLCKAGQLTPKFPVKTHPKQRYSSASGEEDE